MTDIDAETGEITNQPKPFQQFLIEHRHGGLHSELSEGLQSLVAAVAEHDAGGSLTLTIKVTPMKKGTGQYVVADDMRVKAPTGERPVSLFFADGQGNLSRSDPRQPELPLREVPAETPNIREAN